MSDRQWGPFLALVEAPGPSDAGSVEAERKAAEEGITALVSKVAGARFVGVCTHMFQR